MLHSVYALFCPYENKDGQQAVLPFPPLQVWAGVPWPWVGDLAQQGVLARVHRLPCQLPGQRPSLCHPQLFTRGRHDHCSVLPGVSSMCIT